MIARTLIYDLNGRPSKLLIPSRMARLIRTNISLQCPSGHEILVASYMDLAQSRYLFALGHHIDSKDELSVLLYNGGIEPQYVEDNQRIAHAFVLSVDEPEAPTSKR